MKPLRPLRRVAGRIGDWAYGPVATALERIRPWRPLRILVATIALYRRHHCWPRTGEIAYYAVLSVIPFAMLLLTTLAYAAETLIGTGWSLDDLSSTVLDMTRHAMPGLGDELGDGVRRLIRDRNKLGLAGLISILVTASLVFGAVNRALSAIFQIPNRSRLTTTLFFSMLISAMAIVAMEAFRVVITWAPHANGPVDPIAVLADRALPIRILVDAFVAIGFITLILAVVRQRVAFKHMIEGSVLFVALFELARFGFSIYISNLSRLSVIYGSLSGLMVAILWVFYAVLTLLLAVCYVRVRHERLDGGELGDLLPSIRLPAQDGT